MADIFDRFDRRSLAVRAKHMQMADGFVTRLDRNGVLVQVPARRSARFRGLRLVIYVALATLMFKALLVVHLGEDAYDARLADLRTGAAVEQAGAVVMQPDPVSTWIADQIAPWVLSAT